jgi:hypothetical protein
MTSEKQAAWPLRDALRTAQAVLDGDVGVIEGSIALAARAHHIVPDWSVDPDFVVFGVSCYRVEKVGGAIHTEYWIPAEDLPEFNRNIVGRIEVTAEFR